MDSSAHLQEPIKFPGTRGLLFYARFVCLFVFEFDYIVYFKINNKNRGLKVGEGFQAPWTPPLDLPLINFTLITVINFTLTKLQALQIQPRNDFLVFTTACV